MQHQEAGDSEIRLGEPEQLEGMRTIRLGALIVFSLGLVGPWLKAQSVQIAPSLAVAEGQYREAEEAWLRADSTLESDLFKSSPEVMRKRIRRVASLRDDAMAKKTIFLDYMVKRMDDLQSRIVSEKALASPTESFRNDLSEEQARLREEQSRVEERLRQIPKSEEYSQVRSTIEAEEADLLNIRQTVEQRVHALDELTKAQETASGLAQEDDSATKMADLRKIWEGERDRSERSRKMWAKYYEELENSLNKSGASKHPRPH